MAISEKLFLAILAMDAYNRGYSTGIISNSQNALAGVGGTQIGNAAIASNSSILGPNVDVSASFFAQSYTWNGKTVISYRGTDQTFSDAYSGYGLPLGRYWDSQPKLAAQFYQNVRDITSAENMPHGTARNDNFRFITTSRRAG